jgi:Ca2+-binding EF-hand superfamily protein
MSFFSYYQDGLISTDELSAGTDLSKSQAILGIRKLDKDYDGKLNKQEFINLMDSVGLRTKKIWKRNKIELS